MTRRLRDPSPETTLTSLVVRTVLLLACIAMVAFIVLLSEPAVDPILVPVRGVPSRELRDSFYEPREGHRLHEAVDIAAPRSTPVVAVTDGIVHHLGRSDRGGLGLYLIDEAQERCYYYAHLEAYRSGLDEGQRAARGEILGYVGTSGNASDDAPHLHFAVYGLESGKSCAAGKPLNPVGLPMSP